MRKSELSRKKDQIFMRSWFGIQSFPTKGAASVERQEHFVCKIFHKGNGTNIPQSIRQFLWLRLTLKLREWDLDAFKSHFFVLRF